MATSIGFIGAGQIGGPMVRRLLGAGHEVHLHSRRAAVRDEFEALGAAVHADISDTVRATPVVIVCVYGDHQLSSATMGSGGALAHMPRGGLLASHTTGLPSTLEGIATVGASRQIGVVDASFSGAADDVLAGRLTVMLGGTDAQAETLDPFLRSYCGTVLRTGPLGSALKTKLLNNLLFAAHAQLTAGAIALADEIGLETQRFVEIVDASSGGSAFTRRMRTFPSPELMFERIIPYLVKDVAAVRQVAAELDIELGVVGSTVATGPLPLETK